jgi:Carboxypeptidase regulatory-like domain
MTWMLVVLSLMLQSGRAGSPAGAPAQAPATGRIAGRVMAADTGKPLPHARLRLVSFDAMRVARSAGTDENGRFEFDELKPGRYQLQASADRYLTLQFGQTKPPEPGRPIDLVVGQQFDDADFTLPRTGAIEGVLLDEFGDPVPGVVVQLSQLQFVAGRSRLLPVGSRIAVRPTDDKGQFRVFGLAPGDYYVAALSGAFSDQHQTSGFVPTYYPGTAQAGAAVPVHLDFGQDLRNITFALVPGAMSRVAGRLVDEAGKPVRGTVLIAPRDSEHTPAFTVARGGTDASGRFEFRGVPNGLYTIQAFGPSRTGALGQAPFGARPVTVKDEDQDDLVVTITPGASLRGRVTFDGDAPPLKPDQVRIFPRPVEFDSAPIVGGGLPPEVIRDDWTFTVDDLSGLRVIAVDLASAAWTIERVTVNGVDVTDTPVDFRKGDIDGAEIVLTSHISAVQGHVTAADGASVADYSVVVFAADRTKWTFPSRFVALGRPSQDGSFVVRGLPPADYLAVALPFVQGTEWQDPDLLTKLTPGATKFTLGPGEARTVDLKITPRQARRPARRPVSGRSRSTGAGSRAGRASPAAGS